MHRLRRVAQNSPARGQKMRASANLYIQMKHFAHFWGPLHLSEDTFVVRSLWRTRVQRSGFPLASPVDRPSVTIQSQWPSFENLATDLGIYFE